ncbi:MAG: hypothetical protein ACK47R_01525, partial [Planctomycetia bacterium]
LGFSGLDTIAPESSDLAKIRNLWPTPVCSLNEEEPWAKTAPGTILVRHKLLPIINLRLEIIVFPIQDS